MAIIIEEQKNDHMLPVIISVSLAVLTLGGIVYYLFFSPVPGIEDFISSPALKDRINEINAISNIQFDVSQIESSEVYRMLLEGERIAGPEIEGMMGRINPYEPF
jgi:hypothetical protein